MSRQASVDKIGHLNELASKLSQCTEEAQRLTLLSQVSSIDSFRLLKRFYAEEGMKGKLAILSLITIGEGEFIEKMVKLAEDRWKTFLEEVQLVDEFYRKIGGVVGYHAAVLSLIYTKNKRREQVEFFEPSGISLVENSDEVHRMILQGIESLPRLAEIYPVGGAGDRLDLQDEEKMIPLPAACLQFEGRSLLEGLIRDLQAREYLYYKLFSQQVRVPIALMTSEEKNNDEQIAKILENAKWFGRGKSHFFSFVQPLVPVVSKEGKWAFDKPLQLIKKPGGHGVIWKCAKESGAIDWLQKQGVKKCLIRQINNPIAAIDYGLIGFLGVGFSQNKSFGFASCRRKLKTAEGMITLAKKNGRKTLSNIEYAAFDQWGFTDTPKKEGSPYSAFPSNTNILFVDLAHLKEKISHDPFPGLLINMKNSFKMLDLSGKYVVKKGGRLETMMQDISNSFDVDKTFITFSERLKTISVTKNSYHGSGSILETPERAFYDLQKNHYKLLSEICGFQLPHFSSEEEYLEKGPSVLFVYHPALGPLYEIIGQKVQKGSIKEGSELQLEVVEAEIKDLYLDGSLLILADAPLGSKNSEGILEYNYHCGKCVLRQVRVENHGINRSNNNTYWKNKISRSELCQIAIHGNGEFYADNVTFKGNFSIEVPDGYRMVVTESDGSLNFDLQPLEKSSWFWKYQRDDSGRIKITK